MTRTLQRSLYVGAPILAALAVAYFSTRESRRQTNEANHTHGIAQAGSAQPVALTAGEARRIGVTYAVATRSPLAREIRTVGQVTYDETRVTSVSLKVDGWVEQLFVNFTGQSLAAGAPLLALYSPMLVTAQEELLLAKKLKQDVSAGSVDARANAASLLASARRKLAYWDVPVSDVERIEASGEVRHAITLRAPVDGFVVEKSVLQGSRVMAGDALYRIADLSTVWVEGEVFERDLLAVHIGQRVNADLEALPGRTLSGHIAYVYPTIDTDTRTSRVRVELANPALLLKPGMYATLTWLGAGGTTLNVPRTAVVATGERNLVFVKRSDGMLEPRVVALGASNTERVEILRGLALGDTVVKSATFLVDAESNLGTLLGGMGDMPGMDMTAPAPAKTKKEAPRARPNH